MGVPEVWFAVVGAGGANSAAYYQLPLARAGGVLAKPACKQDAPPHPTLRESLRYCGESFRYHECSRHHIDPEMGTYRCREGFKEQDG